MHFFLLHIQCIADIRELAERLFEYRAGGDVVTGVLIASAVLASSLLSPQGSPPTNLQTDQVTAPTAVTHNRPDFEAQNNLGQGATRFQIQLTTQSDPTFAAPLWTSTGPNGGTNFPGNVTVANGSVSPPIPYGQGTANLLNLPLLNWNTSYLWRTKFGINGTWNSSFSASAPFTMAAPTMSIPQQYNNGSPTGTGWRFLSVPIAFGTSVPASELLSVASPLYRLDEPTRTWVALGPTDPLEGGKGYLGWASQSAVLNLSQGKVTAGIPFTVNATGATTIPSYSFPSAAIPSYTFTYTSLSAPTGQEITDGVGTNGYAGNALFGNPFYAQISWKSFNTNGPPFGQIARANISYAMYKWDGTQYLMYNGVTNVGNAGEWIAPFQAVGIWVQNTAWVLDINTPPPQAPPAEKLAPAAPAVPAPPDPDRWYLAMEARSGTALDTENAFGIDPQADDAWDIRDSEEPGAGTPTWVLVYFDHRLDWTTNPRRYTHDFRKTPLQTGNQVVWQFTVDGNTNLPATLTWPNLSSLPLGAWKLTLEDPAQSTILDLSTASSYNTLPVNGPSVLTLRATRLQDSPALAAQSGAGSSGGGGGGSCGLLGPEGLLLMGWILARRGGRMGRRS